MKRWSELLDVLREFHAVAPEYRFGQLICNLATLAGESEIVSPWDVEDEKLVVAARRFLESQQRLERDVPEVRDRWPELLAALQQLGEEYPRVRFGQMVGHLATAVRGPEAGAMWDVENHEVLAVADHWNKHRADQRHAQAEVEQMHREIRHQRAGNDE